MNNGIIILDFGSQYNQLIARRVRELGVYSEVLPFNTPLAEILNKKPVGIILSGGPSSVNAEDAHLVENSLFEAGIPVLGICYGMQLTTHVLGGKVKKGEKGEYGKANLHIDKTTKLFQNVSTDSVVWMSHFDEVELVPEGFEINAKTDVISAISNEEKNILEPTVKGIKESNLNFVGFIFFGVLVENNECYLLEYNMRLGDPETQVIMALLESNLLDVLTDCLEGKEINLSFADKKAVCLVMTSGGYPGNYETGYEITGIDKVKDSEVLFAGAEIEHGKIVTTGGRVLNIVATGDTYQEARKKVYQDALSVRFDYAYYREDIGNF